MSKETKEKSPSVTREDFSGLSIKRFLSHCQRVAREQVTKELQKEQEKNKEKESYE